MDQQRCIGQLVRATCLLSEASFWGRAEPRSQRIRTSMGLKVGLKLCSLSRAPLLPLAPLGLDLAPLKPGPGPLELKRPFPEKLSRKARQLEAQAAKWRRLHAP